MNSRWERCGQVTDPELEIVVAPSGFFNTNGMQLGPNGRVWVTSTLGAEVISVVAGDTGTRQEVPLTGGLGGPDDLAFTPDGTAFFTEPHHDRVMRRSPTGRIEVWAENLPSANGITITPEGRLFIDECRPEGRLVEIDTEVAGAFAVRAHDLGMPNALCGGPDGRLYLPEVSLDRVSAIDPASGALEVIVSDVGRPSSVKFHPDGRLIVSSAASGEVLAVDRSSGARTVLVAAMVGLDNTAFDRAGNLYVSNFVNSQLLVIGVDGSVAELSPPSLVQPTSVESNGAGGYLIANRTSVVDTQRGALMRMPVELSFGVTHAHTAGGTLYLLAADGRLLRGSEVLRTGVSCINSSPMGLLVAKAGAVHFVGAAGSDGAGVYSAVTTGLERVDAVCADHDAVAACDRAAGVVCCGDRRWSGFREPAALALNRDALFVAELGSRAILRVDRTSGARAVLASNVPIGSPVAASPVELGLPGMCLDGAQLVIACNGDASIRRVQI